MGKAADKQLEKIREIVQKVRVERYLEQVEASKKEQIDGRCTAVGVCDVYLQIIWGGKEEPTTTEGKGKDCRVQGGNYRTEQFFG